MELAKVVLSQLQRKTLANKLMIRCAVLELLAAESMSSAT
jgi:hypothetical protein